MRTEPCTDLYVRDLARDTTTLASAASGGNDSGNGWSGGGDFTPDGKRIVFTSSATNLGPFDGNGTEDVCLATLTEPPPSP